MKGKFSRRQNVCLSWLNLRREEFKGESEAQFYLVPFCTFFHQVYVLLFLFKIKLMISTFIQFQKNVTGRCFEQKNNIGGKAEGKVACFKKKQGRCGQEGGSLIQVLVVLAEDLCFPQSLLVLSFLNADNNTNLCVLRALQFIVTISKLSLICSGRNKKD